MYRPLQPDLLNAMTPAQRARTVLAAAGPVPWQIATSTAVAPFFEVQGCPILLLEQELTGTLLAAGRTTVRLDLLPALGRVELSGYVEPAGDEFAEFAARYRAEHAHCDPICGTGDRDLVRVVIDHVGITGPGGEGGYAPVQIQEYRRSVPHALLVECLAVAEHLNQDHPMELLTLGSHLSGLPESALLAVSVDWIDPNGIDLSVIDVDGSLSVHADFHQPLTSVTSLGVQLHRMLQEPLSRLRVDQRVDRGMRPRRGAAAGPGELPATGHNEGHGC